MYVLSIHDSPYHFMGRRIILNSGLPGNPRIQIGALPDPTIATGRFQPKTVNTDAPPDCRRHCQLQTNRCHTETDMRKPVSLQRFQILRFFMCLSKAGINWNATGQKLRHFDGRNMEKDEANIKMHHSLVKVANIALRH